VNNDASCQVNVPVLTRDKMEKALIKTKPIKCPKHLVLKTIKTELYSLQTNVQVYFQHTCYFFSWLSETEIIDRFKISIRHCLWYSFSLFYLISFKAEFQNIVLFSSYLIL